MPTEVMDFSETRNLIHPALYERMRIFERPYFPPTDVPDVGFANTFRQSIIHCLSTSAIIQKVVLERLSALDPPGDNMASAQKEHFEYLRRVSLQKDPLISIDTAKKAKRAWQDLYKASGYALPIPAACAGPDGQMAYSWDAGKHHFELEIFPDNPAEFFYRNRETRDLWGEDFVIGGPVTQAVRDRLRLFSGKNH